MTTESLHNIIAVENELHAQEQAEKARAEQWLAAQSAAMHAELRQCQAVLAQEMEAARQQARANAESRAAETVRMAEERARRLAGVGDKDLGRILEQHLIAIVTGRLP